MYKLCTPLSTGCALLTCTVHVMHDIRNKLALFNCPAICAVFNTSFASEFLLFVYFKLFHSVYCNCFLPVREMTLLHILIVIWWWRFFADIFFNVYYLV